MSQCVRWCFSLGFSGFSPLTMIASLPVFETHTGGISASAANVTVTVSPSAVRYSTRWRGAGSTPASVSMDWEPRRIPLRLRSLIVVVPP
jgi:hypothetical protein